MKIKLAIAALVAVVISTASYAGHSWGVYHWARTSSPFVLTIVDSTTSTWPTFVALAIGDWSVSSVLSMHWEQGDTKSRTRRRCKPPGGKVRICNLAYGNTGWVGLAGISIDSAGHIVSGYTKLNDTYFATGFYNDDAWRQSVTCQELGHNIGLGHQDVDFYNKSLDSCMDYQSDPWKYPNAHDYEQLETIYDHTEDDDGVDGGGGGNDGCNAPPGKGCNKGEVPGRNGDIGWGMSIGRRGQTETFMRIDPDGTRHITYVTWVQGH
ncbi:MAG: hypothetical protein IIA07_11675 [Proteobacteria bacterium]|nr:hypothetical protein [Pseudomonadota bacterium]